jgi:hypothetical protein
MAQVLHASYSGYFPFCLTKGTPPQTGKGTNYPISLSLAKYMSWWWKVKTWEVSGGSTGNEIADGGNLYNRWTTISLNQDPIDTMEIGWTTQIESEQNLVCQEDRILSFGFNAFSIRSDENILSTNNSVIYFPPSAYVDGSTIYPEIILAGWYSTEPGDPKVQKKVDPNSSLKIDGITIPCYINWYPIWTEYADWNWTGNQSFEINPATYWPYNP